MALVIVQQTKQTTMPVLSVRRGNGKGVMGNTGDGKEEERATTKSVDT